MTNVSLKRGDTFAVLCQRVDATGAPIDVTPLTITAELRGGAFSSALTVTKIAGTNGTFWLSATPAATATWPVTAPGVVKTQFDVQFDDGDTVISSDTVAVTISLDMTQTASAVTGLPPAGTVALTFKDRAPISGAAGVGQTLEAAVLYQGPVGPIGPPGPMGDVTPAALAAEVGAQAAQTAAEAAAAAAAAHDTSAAQSAQNAAASVGTTQDTTFGANEGEIASIVGQIWKALSSIPTDLPVTENGLLQGLSLLGQIAKQINGGRIRLGAGTLADPAMKIGTVGVYSSATDTLSFAVAGVEILRITASGIAVYGTTTSI